MTSQPTRAESPTFVGTEAAQARIARLPARRGAAERVDSVRATTNEATQPIRNGRRRRSAERRIA
jgi:hypothetical protein